MAQGSFSILKWRAHAGAPLAESTSSFLGADAFSNGISQSKSRRDQGCCPLSHSFGLKKRAPSSRRSECQVGLQVEALQRRATEGLDDNSKIGKGGDTSALENGSWIRGKSLSEVDASDPFWEQIGAGLRITYAAGVYGVMALAGQALCHFSGVDNIGGFEMCPDVAMQGIGYAVPPMMALLFILDDEVVKKSPPARAIRDVEDEELFSFFVGMSPWQLVLVVSMAAVAEEVFFRIAIQGCLAHVFLSDDKIRGPSDGIAVLTGVFPFFAPFAHALAAVLTAALTGSILFITSFPQDPTYVIAPVHRNRTTQGDLKKSFAAWYERRQLKKIYSPLLDSLLALYLGFEWTQTGNILAPMVTHMIYSAVIVGNGLRRVHDRREKLRQRTLRFWEKETLVSQSQSNAGK